MSRVSLIVGAPAWDRAWSLPLWFQSVRANVDPAATGLAFVVSPADLPTRDAIAALSDGFAWVEVMRDHGEQAARHDRPAQDHRNLAACRNQILALVERVGPDRYLSWDTDFLVAPGTVALAARHGFPLATVWAWTNRQPPRPMRWRNGRRWEDVLVQDPVCATAMDWRRAPCHYPGREYADRRAAAAWRCRIALVWQLMDRRAYRVASYAPHYAGEDVPFNMMLAARGVERWCLGGGLGVHLYDRARADERALGWPGVMALAGDEPLASRWRGGRAPEYEALGLYPSGMEEAA